MFNKNLRYLNNTRLKADLEKISLEESRRDISYCMTNSNDYLLMKNDIPLDDIDNPREAIKQMLAVSIKQPMQNNDIIVIFGIGLCYILDEVFNTYPCRIFLYEPDTNLLHFVLNNVDISEHLSSGRIYISDRKEELIRKLKDSYITKDKVEVVYLKNYAIVKSNELLEFTQMVYDTCKSKMVDINTITRYSSIWTENMINNISIINNSEMYMLSDLEGKFHDQTALIIAAGPSFEDNIEKIKANRDKYVIFAVNKVLKEVLAAGIKPDFAVCLDAMYVDKTFAGIEEYLPNINCITDLKTSECVYKSNFKKIFVSFSENEMLVKSLREFNQSIKTYDCGGSAATMAFVSAVKMGFAKIIFSGLDLAFKQDIMYASGEKTNRISQDKIEVDSAEKNITRVKSVNGDMVMTRDDYAAYIDHFKTLISDLGYTEVYNTTSFGANIEGIKNTPFERISLIVTSNTTPFILGEVQPFKLQVSQWAQNELSRINEIITLLSKDAFSPALVSSIVKSPLMYGLMQADILRVVQSGMNIGLAEEFMTKTKQTVKKSVDLLQSKRFI